MRTARTLRTTAIAVVAAAGISLGAASGAMAATASHTAGPASISVESIAHSKTKKPKKAKTVKLRDGSIAKVYKLGKNKAKAVISGPKGATLLANGRTVYVNHNGMHIKLTPSGSLTSWMNKAKPKPKPKPKPHPEKREHVRNDTLADGSMARVYKFSPTHWQAVTSAGSLDANGRTASGENNGMHVTLSPSGVLKSWMDKAGDEPAPAPVPDDEVQPDPQPTPDDEVQPDPQPVPDDVVKPDPKPVPDDVVKPAPKPAPDTDTVKPAPTPAPGTDAPIVPAA
ncbi:hypothetical protein [Streptomyces sp. Je 1-332]|uniref:hypothetical protein n=1 Tax=Streptomyces sp. Je 1-332 TaxID=3231270 RepID=UPI00345887BF